MSFQIWPLISLPIKSIKRNQGSFESWLILVLWLRKHRISLGLFWGQRTRHFQNEWVVSWAWWHTPVMPATQEAATGGSQVRGQSGQLSKTSSVKEYVSSMWKALGSITSTIKKKERERQKKQMSTVAHSFTSSQLGGLSQEDWKFKPSLGNLVT